jgi:hypothetical protein
VADLHQLIFNFLITMRAANVTHLRLCNDIPPFQHKSPSSLNIAHQRSVMIPAGMVNSRAKSRFARFRSTDPAICVMGNSSAARCG